MLFSTVVRLSQVYKGLNPAPIEVGKFVIDFSDSDTVQYFVAPHLPL